MFMKTIALIVCLFCFIMFGITNFNVEAQTLSGTQEYEVSVDPVELTEGYSAVLYDNSNGLPTSEANAIAQTSEGFVWIGSYCGLIRYDGNSFERLNIQGIASVISLYVDSKERLWVGTNDGGVAVIDRDDCQIFGKAEGLTAASVRSIVEDSTGKVYVATTGGISIIDEESNVYAIDEPQIKSAFIDELRIGNNNIIYGVTVEGNVFTLENGIVTGFYSCKELGIDGIISILPDLVNSGYVYLGTESSTIYYGTLDGDINSFKKLDISPLGYVKSMEQFKDEIWICSDKGIGVIKDDKFSKIENIPLNNSIEQVMTDYQGNLWFTSSRQGVMKIVKNQFLDIFEKYNLPAVVVNTTCKTNDILYIGTDSGLIALNERSNEIVENILIKRINSQFLNEEINLIEFLKDVRIRSIIKDSKGQLWISTWKKQGLICFKNENLTIFNEENGLPSNRVRTVYEQKNGDILVACTGGVAVIHNKNVVKVYGQDVGIENPEILTVIEKENGDIVLGTDGGGIYVLSGSKTKHIGIESGLISEVIMRVKEDKENSVLWIVTSNSLAYMDEEYNVNTIKNFPYSNNFDLYKNSKGQMWVLSSDGLYVTSADELIENEEITAEFYGRENGLTYISTGNSYSELSDSGELYISGTNGVSKVNIEKPFENVSNIKMAVPFIEADGKKIYPDSNGDFEIESNVQKLTVYSYVYTYALENPQVSYCLNGFEKDENIIEKNNLLPISYSKLKGGKYNFVMFLKDSIGAESKKLSINIVKKAAFHETVWFYLVLAGVLALFIEKLVRFNVRRKIKRYQKKDEENRAIIRGITKAFARVIDMKDKYTKGHSFRVAKYTAMLARELGYSEQDVEKFYNIALLHDVGKIGIHEEVLKKNGKLTDEEFAEIKKHTSLGYKALREITIMPELADGARYHHERPDGKGYNGLIGDEIPKVAQIIGVADAFDAMYSDRPYRKRMNFDKVCSIIAQGSGTQFAEDVVSAFLKLVHAGKFKATDDFGGGTTEEVENIK